MYVTPHCGMSVATAGGCKGTGHIVAWASPRLGAHYWGVNSNLIFGASDTQPGLWLA